MEWKRDRHCLVCHELCSGGSRAPVLVTVDSTNARLQVGRSSTLLFLSMWSQWPGAALLHTQTHLQALFHIQEVDSLHCPKLSCYLLEIFVRSDGSWWAKKVIVIVILLEVHRKTWRRNQQTKNTDVHTAKLLLGRKKIGLNQVKKKERKKNTMWFQK